MVTLRPYQEAAVRAAFDAWRDGLGRVVWSMPTGTGKTVAFAAVAERVLRSCGRVLILAHREELIQQARDKLVAFAPWAAGSVGIVKAERDEWEAPCVVASVQTLQGPRLERYAPEAFALVIVDEAHHAAAPSYRRILDHLGAPHVLGVTATPKRGDGVGLHEVFARVVYSYGMQDAIREGHLCDIRQFAVETTTDLDAVATRDGDFVVGQLADTVNTPERNALVVKAFLERGPERKAVAFCVDVAHAQALAEEFRAWEVEAEAVWGAMGDEARAEALARFAAGELQVLCNCQLLTEGWDEPSVACVLMARPTKSRTLYQQAVGRGTRLCRGKPDLLVLDFVDATRRHNLVTTPDLLGDSCANMRGKSWSQREREIAEERERAQRATRAPQWTRKRMAFRLREVDPFEPTAPVSLFGYVERVAWHRQAASEKQLAVLAKRGMDPEVLASLSKGEASFLIDQVSAAEGWGEKTARAAG
jgi:superfamily II DNA or RNA helicase